MDLLDAYQNIGLLLGTLVLWRWMKSKHSDWENGLKAFRTPDLDIKNKRRHLDVKVVTDPRLGRLGINSIWCEHPGARCTCMTCRWNRKYGEPKPAVEPPPPIYPDGPRYRVEPAIPLPPPTSLPGEPERQRR